MLLGLCVLLAATLTKEVKAGVIATCGEPVGYCIAGTTRAQRGYNWGEKGLFLSESGVHSLVRCGPKRL